MRILLTVSVNSVQERGMLIQKVHQARRLQRLVCGKGLAKLLLLISTPALSRGACCLRFTILNIVVALIILKRTRVNLSRYVYSISIVF